MDDPAGTEYLHRFHLDEFLEQMRVELMRSQPHDPRSFMMQFVQESFRLDEEPAMPTRRMAISAEPVDFDAKAPTKVPKTPEQVQEIQRSLSSNVMFSHLEEDDRLEVFEYMTPVSVEPGTKVTTQGEDGDLFYIVSRGNLTVWKSSAPNEEPKQVAKVAPGGSFGELALIYGSPRAATVIADTPCELWAIDRVTYRRVLMKSTTSKRNLYESFLAKVPILSPLDHYERLLVADALEPATFEDGQIIIREATLGQLFCIIVQGRVDVLQRDASGADQVVSTLSVSDYFGERSLLMNQPTAASIRASGRVKVVSLDKERFNMVMGPCEDVLMRNIELYKRFFPSE